MMKRFLLAGAMLLAVGGQSFGALVLNYSYTGAAGNQASTTATTVDANAIATAITRGAGLTAAAAGNSISSSGWPTTSTLTPASDYYTFSFTPNAGFQATLNTLDFRHRISSGTAATFEVRSSLDGFATFSTQGVGTLSTTANTLRSVTLTGLTDFTQTAEFRIYGLSFAATGTTWRLENGTGVSSALGTVLDGSVSAVPEPTSIALMGIACTAIVVTRVSRRKNSKSVVA